MILHTFALLHADIAGWSFNVSLLVSVAGLLLLYLECNRPGRVVPGAVGLLLLLLGLHSLGLLPLRLGALFPVALAFALLAVPLRHPPAWIWLATGTTLLTLGLASLSAQQAWSPVGAACGLLLGPVTAWLATIAGRARRAKRHLPRTLGQSSADTLTHGWE